jgi:hypothetical protein
LIPPDPRAQVQVLQREIAGAIADVKLRTVIEVVERIDRWKRDKIGGRGGPTTALGLELRAEISAAIWEVDHGTTEALYARIEGSGTGWKDRGLGGPFLDEEMTRAREETRELLESMDPEGRKAIAAIANRIIEKVAGEPDRGTSP